MSYLFPINALPPPADDGQNSNLAAQVTFILHKLPLILMADMLVGTYLFITLIMLFGGWLPAVWYGTLSLSCLTRGLFIYAIYHYPRTLSTTRQRYLYVLSGAVIGGMIWGSIWFYLPSSAGSVEYGLLVLWQCGVLAGAAATLSINKSIYFSFITSPVIVSVLFLFFQLDMSQSILMGAFVCYVFFITPMGLHIGMELDRGISLERKNLSLEKSLKLDREKLQSKEIELQQQKAREESLVSEVTRSDKKLKAATEERLLLLESIEIGIIGVNNHGKITFANPSALRFLGYKDDEIIGEPIRRLVRRLGGDAETFIATTSALTASYESGISSTDRQSEFITKAGSTVPVQFSSRPIYSRGEIIGAVVSFSDISKQREMENMLVQTQKLEALGRITGGVAHDFNNLLTIIIGNLQFLRKQPGLSGPMQDLIAKIMNAAKSGSDLVSRLLGFSKEQRLRLESYDLNVLLSDIGDFLGRILGENIELDIVNCEQRCNVVTDKTQFQNAILNLCVNAKDAMPNGGKLRLAPKLMSAKWSLPTSKPGTRFVELSVEDNGTGFDQEVQAHIFDPFFTTKDSDKGSGLGLSTVYGFIKQSGGSITVHSEINKGTTFKVYLPVSEQLSEPSVIPVHPEQNTKFQGTVLVVEDDDEVRSVAAQILIGAGFEVITAKDGNMGLELFNSHPEIDLVFSDIIMPGGMSGIEMAKLILQKMPNKPILLVTGYTDKKLDNKIPNQKNIICLPKPFDADELPKVIDSLIGASLS